MLLKSKLIISLILFSTIAFGQNTNSEKIGTTNQSEPASADPLSEVLKEKGISLDKIDPTSVQSTKDLIRKTIDEVNNETGATTAYREEVVTDPIEESIIIDDPRVADDIVERLKEGSTFNEAVTEELAENEIQGASRIYGQHIFVNNTIEVYRGSSTGKIPGTYVLDEGDEIAINIFGISQADLVYQIDKDGFIRPTNVPKIYLKGITLEKAKDIINKRFSLAYRYSRDQIAVELKTARTVNVSIFGQVTREGSYTLSALNSVLNALVLADGLQANGSVRNIKVLSDGKERTIDIYEFLSSGSVKPDYFLKNNDIIYVPIADNVVYARGEFRRKGYFELKKGEGFNELLKFTEGLTTSGRQENIEIVRKESDGENKLYNFDYETLTKENTSLQDLDVISVAYQDRRLENYFIVSGAVRNRGRFEWKENLRLSDAMNESQIEEFARKDIGYLVRKMLNGQYKIERIHPKEAIENPGGLSDIVLMKEDKITILSEKDYIYNYAFSIEGAVKRSLNHEWAPFQTLQLSDAILMSGGLRPNAAPFGYIIRKSVSNSEKFEYVFIEVRKAMNDINSEYNIKISPNDKIVIPSIELYYDELNISITGGVRNPITIVYDPTLSLKQMIAMAGGLTFEAASNRIDVFRLQINENEPTRTLATSITVNKNIEEMELDGFELMPFDQIVVRNTPEFEPIKVVTIRGEVKYPGPYAIVGNNYKLTDLIEASGGVTEEANVKGGKVLRTDENRGYVITKMGKALKRSKSDYNIILNKGDIVTIPRAESVVHINTNSTRASEIYTEDAVSPIVNVAYKRGRSTRHYINRYVGGFAKHSKRSNTVVETKSGAIKKTRNFYLFKVYPKVEPGSTVLAYAKEAKSEKQRTRWERRENLSATERLMQLQTIITVASSTVTTAITSVLLVKSL